MPTAEQVTEAQRRLRDCHGMIVVPRTRAQFRAIARWWELEAMRGCRSSDSGRQYARNYRWFVELMDAGHRVTADAHGVYIDGELASKVQERNQRAEQRKKQSEEDRATAARREAERPDCDPRKRRREDRMANRRRALR